MDLLHRHITRLVNWHVVNHLLLLNFGEESLNTVFLEASPLADSTLATLKEIYVEVIKSPLTAMDEMRNLDLTAMRNKLGIPSADVITELGSSVDESVDEPE